MSKRRSAKSGGGLPKKGKLIFAALALLPLDLLAVAIDVGLIAVDLLLLLVIGILLALHLIADQSACAQAEGSSHSGTGTRMTYCRPDEAARRRSAQSADSCAFLTGTQRPASTTREE